MSQMFQSGERPRSPVLPFEDDDLAGKPSSKTDYSSRVEGPARSRLAGHSRSKVDRRKFRYDVIAGAAKNVGFEVVRDDRLSAQAGGDMLDNIHVKFGVDRQSHEFLAAFDSALFLCHTLNSGSSLVPGRSGFSVAGYDDQYSFAVVRNILGTDMRRFFRTFADEIADVNKRVLAAYDPFDVVKEEQYSQLMAVATDRCLQRFPHLAHDSADACSNLNMTERRALASSKVAVIATSNNSADRMMANSRAQSNDNYDSTTGAVA